MRFTEDQDSRTAAGPDSRRESRRDRRPAPDRGSNGQSTADSSSPLSAFDSLVVVSNRQPYSHEYADADDAGSNDDESEASDGPISDGGTASLTRQGPQRSITVDTPSGGLTAGLDPVVRRTGGTWIAWGDGDADREVVDENDCVQVPPQESSGGTDAADGASGRQDSVDGAAGTDAADRSSGADATDGEADTYTLRRLWLSEDELDAYYYGFSNRVLWPLCHERPDLVEDREGDFEGYRRVNRQFADAVTEHATPSSLVWLQDYHLGLAPSMIRERLPESTTLGQFWHVPWPRPEVFRQCPHGRELLTGLLGNDLLGFHVDRWAEAFLATVDRLLPAASVDFDGRTVRHGGSTTQVVATPMGVDAADHDRQARQIDGDRYDRFRDEYDIPEDVALGLGIDRLDYSKGIPQRLAAVERLFERWPAWRGSFTYVQTATPSRTEIGAYEELGAFVRSEVERINDRFGTDHWQPIVYTEDYLDRETLCALYRNADAMLVSPLLDGMNLVAQEYVAANVDERGALLLSERAGAHDTLGDLAYSIDPERTDEFAATLERALSAPPAANRRRMRDLRTRVFDRDLDCWMDRQFAELARAGDADASGRTTTNRSSNAGRAGESGRSTPR